MRKITASKIYYEMNANNRIARPFPGRYPTRILLAIRKGAKVTFIYNGKPAYMQIQAAIRHLITNNILEVIEYDKMSYIQRWEIFKFERRIIMQPAIEPNVKHYYTHGIFFPFEWRPKKDVEGRTCYTLPLKKR